MKKNAIISLADSSYYELLIELINSIKRFKNSSDVSICVLNAGLTEDQVNNISKKLMKLKMQSGISRSFATSEK